MINPEAKQEWRGNPVTIEMMELLEQEKQRLMESMGYGHFLNLDNPMGSFGSAAKTVGAIEGINTVFKLLQEEEHE
jgi:hypothetical protein